MKLLLSGGRRLFLAKPHSQLHSSSFPLFQRWMSNDSEPKDNPTLLPPSAEFRTQPIQPVSYAVKPKEQVSPDTNESPSEQKHKLPADHQEVSNLHDQDARMNWTQEDMRYLKDMQPTVPISFPARVAPLPEDRVGAEGEEKERERSKIERTRFSRVVEEDKIKVPFPRLLMPLKREKSAQFELMDAIRQVKTTARKTFDETLEAHVRLGIPKGRSDLIVRGTFSLPHGEKKVLRVAVFAEGSDAEEAKAAGADVVGGVELIDEIASTGKVDFDKCFTTPKLYPRVAKLARILNRHGLMPDRKQGTVVSNVTRAVKDAKKNQIMFKMDKSSIVHVGLGKVSFTEESLRENVVAFMNSLLLAKPAGLKKTSKYAGYVTSFHICSTMGHGLPVSMQSVSKAVNNLNKAQN